jgi:hypothetical protein
VTQRSYVYNISSVKDSRWIQPSIELKDYVKRDELYLGILRGNLSLTIIE